MRLLASLLLTWSCCAVAVGPARASDGGNLLEAGDRVRLTTSRQVTVVGIVTAVGRDSLTVEAISRRIGAGDSRTHHGRFEYPLASLVKLEVSAGRKPATGRGALRGAMWAGLIVGIVEAAACSSSDACTYGAATALWAGIGGAAGALIGSGKTVEKWEKLRLPPQAALRDQRPAMPRGVSVTFRF